MSTSSLESDKVLILREQLPLPGSYVAPRTSTENALANIWSTALSMDRVGIHDRYQDLGGDSLHAIVIFSMIEDEFRIAVPMATLVTASTVAELAGVIDHFTTAAR